MEKDMSARVKIEKYDNGQVQIEKRYDADGRRHGLSREWHENGQLSYERHWAHGKLNGAERYWSRNGRLIYIHSYANNDFEGVSFSLIFGILDIDRKGVPQLQLQVQTNIIQKFPSENKTLFSKKQWKELCNKDYDEKFSLR